MPPAKGTPTHSQPVSSDPTRGASILFDPNQWARAVVFISSVVALMSIPFKPSSPRCSGLLPLSLGDLPVNLFAVHGHVSGGGDAQTNHTAADVDNRYLDVVADPDRSIPLAR